MPERIPEINLLPEIREENPIYAYLFYIFLVLILISFIVMTYLYFSTNNKLDDALTKSEELSVQRESLFTELDRLEANESSQFEQAVTYVESHQLPTSVLIDKLNNLLPKHAYLSEYVYNNLEVEVTTEFETLDQVANYITDVTNLDYVSDIQLDKVESFLLKDEDSDEEIVDFTTIPRYESDFSLTIDKPKLKEESEKDE